MTDLLTPRRFGRDLGGMDLKFPFASSGPDLTTGLTAFWAFEEAAGNPRVDSVGSTSLSEIGGTVSQVAGIVGNAAASATNTLKALNAASGAVNPAGQSFSVSVWWLTDSFGRSSQLGRYGGATQEWLIQSFYDGIGNRLKCILFNNVGDAVGINAPFGTYLATSAWTHQVMTYNAATRLVSLYLNASLLVTGTLPGTVQPGGSNSDMVVDFTNNNADVLSHAVDQLRFYRNRVLGATEIAALYNSGAGV